LLKVSNNNGQDFGKNILLSNTFSMMSNSQFDSLNDNLYITWTEIHPKNVSVFFTESSDGGKTMSDLKKY